MSSDVNVTNACQCCISLLYQAKRDKAKQAVVEELQVVLELVYTRFEELAEEVDRVADAKLEKCAAQRPRLSGYLASIAAEREAAQSIRLDLPGSQIVASVRRQIARISALECEVPAIVAHRGALRSPVDPTLEVAVDYKRLAAAFASSVGSVISSRETLAQRQTRAWIFPSASERLPRSIDVNAAANQAAAGADVAPDAARAAADDNAAAAVAATAAAVRSQRRMQRSRFIVERLASRLGVGEPP